MNKQQFMAVIRDTYSSAEEYDEIHDELVKIVLKPGLQEVMGASGRTQTVWLIPLENTVKIMSPFAAISDITAEEAIALSSQTGLGVQTYAGFYACAHMLRYEEAAESIYFWIDTVAQVGDDLDGAIDGGDDF